MMSVSALSSSLSTLVEFLEQCGLPPPVRELRIVEVTHAAARDELGRLVISGDEVQQPPAYEPRFEELMHSGMPWVNISCYGVYSGHLIIGVELPDYAIPKDILR